jgi:hypothetical protein
MLKKIRRIAKTTQELPGTTDPCERWVDAFALLDHEWMDGDCVFQAGSLQVFNVGAPTPWTQGRHVVYRVVLCDGSIFYVDNGIVGGSDHVGLPSEIPEFVLGVVPTWRWRDLEDWEPFIPQLPPTGPTPTVQPTMDF